MNIRLSLTGRILVLVIMTLVVLNGVTGYILIYYSQAAIKTQIKNRMLDISNTAAASIDGDIYEHITAEDIGTPEYEALLDKLRLFQDNIELAYIYGIRDNGNKYFTFTIDPTVEDPGEFDEPIKYTDALYKASLGVASVDDEAYMDKWGKFYSAYSPVKNSAGEVVGIIAVDFDATWYDKTVSRNVRIIVSSCAVSLMMGILLVIFTTSRVRDRFRKFDQEMYGMEDDIDKFFAEDVKYEDENAKAKDTRYPRGIISYSKDEIDILGDHIQSLIVKVRNYANVLNIKSYKDEITGVGNRKAYAYKIAELEEKNEESEKEVHEYTVAIFDVRDLKKINDDFGYSRGDIAINIAAKALENTFVGENETVYHLGGDEFAAIIDGKSQDEIVGTFNLIDEHLNSLCEKNDVRNDADQVMRVKLNKGAATFDKEKDAGFEDVFRRAEASLWENRQNQNKKKK